ncbi:helix-turn-helix transcriptional regulator [Microbacterium sp. SORGH_AS_0888]|uniref:helix-turn-helix domain-containing protein n=1 Tax=Microbacterium sp. SORGH_AS_0888 TaxID=3041791 RepID=UPI00277E4DCE|nr:helix-turn-helix transcriptional regulator [Microbacterium sp. SORGH_AS_0888]MDQ1131361.1 transcriptional regulator with XRE-family HTH domain [Microbacterium sp. SORGH_AS_0888]
MPGADDGAGDRADDVRAFAADLRELRYAAGNPTLQALAARTYISKSVLSSAFAGRHPPTPNTTERLVTALGGEAEGWQRRLSALRARESPRPARAHVPRTPAPTRDGTRRRLIVAATAVALVAAVAASTAVWWAPDIRSASDSRRAPARAGASTLPVVPASDPMQTVCREDAQARAVAPRLDGALVLTLFSSRSCGAAWAEVTREDDTTRGEPLTIEVYRQGDRYGGRGKPRTSTDATSVRTGLLLDVAAGSEICALVSMSDAGVPVELGPPLCA